MKFEDAIPALRAGRWIKRASWADRTEHLRVETGGELFHCSNSDEGDAARLGRLMQDLLASDWKIYDTEDVGFEPRGALAPEDRRAMHKGRKRGS